jgi:hypothetical protein
LGVVKPPPWATGVVYPPSRAKHPNFIYLIIIIFFSLALGVVWPNTQIYLFFIFIFLSLTLAGDSATPKPTMGVAPLAKIGLAGHPMVVKFFFFFFLIFFFVLLF